MFILILTTCNLYESTIIRIIFLPWPLPERQAMVLWPRCLGVTDHLPEKTRTDMSARPATGVE